MSSKRRARPPRRSQELRTKPPAACSTVSSRTFRGGPGSSAWARCLFGWAGSAWSEEGWQNNADHQIHKVEARVHGRHAVRHRNGRGGPGGLHELEVVPGRAVRLDLHQLEKFHE